MKKTSITINIFIFLIFATLIFTFSKILINATTISSQIVDNVDYELYKANHQPIKIFPKAEKNSYLTTNQRVYDFVNKKSWQFNPTIANTQPKKDTSKYQLKSGDPINNNKKAKGDIINYKNHKIHITDLPKKQKTTDKASNIIVQLGAFNAYNKAITEKKRITRLFPNLLKKYTFYIEKSYIEQKGLIYRLRIKPFNNTVNAKNFCANIRKKDIGCFFRLEPA